MDRRIRGVIQLVMDSGLCSQMVSLLYRPEQSCFVYFSPTALEYGMNCRYWVIIKVLLTFYLLLCDMYKPCVFQFLICFYLLSSVRNIRQDSTCNRVSSYVLKLKYLL